MTWADDIIAMFGSQIGIKNLSFDDHGSLTLILEKDGTLCLERKEDYIVISLLQPQNMLNAKTLIEALRLCHPDNPYKQPIAIGAYKDKALAFMMTIGKSDFSMPAIDAAITQLANLHGKVSRI